MLPVTGDDCNPVASSGHHIFVLMDQGFQSFSRPRRNTHFMSALKPMMPVQTVRKKYSSFVFTEIMIICRIRLMKRDVSRSSRHVEAGSGGRIGLQRGLSARTNKSMRTVKSCGPGLPVLRPIWRRYANDGGKNAGPQGEHEAAVKAIAQGRPDIG